MNYMKTAVVKQAMSSNKAKNRLHISGDRFKPGDRYDKLFNKAFLLYLHLTRENII